MSSYISYNRIGHEHPIQRQHGSETVGPLKQYKIHSSRRGLNSIECSSKTALGRKARRRRPIPISARIRRQHWYQSSGLVLLPAACPRTLIGRALPAAGSRSSAADGADRRLGRYEQAQALCVGRVRPYMHSFVIFEWISFNMDHQHTKDLNKHIQSYSHVGTLLMQKPPRSSWQK